ncbi:UDP-galactose transporter 2 [Micractinium conductrix]|uniref:UDP-galactose transporter 2 n=1 Tax=Micractinium conductrix TaxID=554055 RepID=A0A2P6V6M0_9CHLO|nr:UDP-galactose transporter 2 [Micractinium conductrix]|eukprot:PSC69736.1 UDP-galactose transporter 2 [Micractinium conductrix]
MDDAGAEPALKRKKTVTWADDEALEVPLAGDAAAAPAASPAALGPLLDADAVHADAAVVKLPCDGMFEALSLDLLQQQVGQPPELSEDGGEAAAGGEPVLSRRQLLERRLARSRQLSQLYESELWGLLEELRLRHAQFAALPGLSLWKEGGTSGAGGEAVAKGEAAEAEEGEERAPRPTKRQKQKLAKQARQGKQPAKAATAAAPAAAEADKEQSKEESGEQQQAADGAPGALLRALWERQQQTAQPPAEQQQQPEKQGKQAGKAAAAKGKPGKQAKGSPKEQQQPAGKAHRKSSAVAAEPAAGGPAEAAPPQPPPPLPRFEDVEQLLLSGDAAGLPPVNEAALVVARASFVRRLGLLGRLEQSALAATCRELDSLGGLALLCGRRRRYVLRRGVIALGRCTDSQGKVDVDLAGECEGGSAQRVSRQQAQLFLDAGVGHAGGGWRLRCTGRRPLLVNGQTLARGQTVALPTLSHIRIGDISLLFVSNTAAEARATTVVPLQPLRPQQPLEGDGMGSKGSLHGGGDTAARAKLLSDIGAWAGNVSTSVFIVFINKMLMKNFGYHYATTLTALHFLVCAIAIWFAQRGGYIKPTTMPFNDLMLFTVIADISILTLNLSLMLNTVSFYQIAKLLIIPFVCFVESSFLGRTFSREVVSSIVLVICGVAVVTVQDLQLDISLGGMLIAAVSVVSSGLQQIFVRTMQQKHKLSAHELLSNTAPAQAWTLLLVGPFIDKLVSADWVFAYRFTSSSMSTMIVSCSLAVLVNISQFMCLGRFSAVSFQVLGHSKTMLVLLGGWAFLGDTITGKKFCGMMLAVSGMVWYGKASSNQSRALARQMKVVTPESGSAGDRLVEKAPLLREHSSGNLRVTVNAGVDPASHKV